MRPKRRKQGPQKEPGQTVNRMLGAAGGALQRVPRPVWLGGGGVMLAMVVGAFVLYANCGLGGCPSPEILAAYQAGGAPELLDRNGERFADLAPYERVVVSLDSLPAFLPEAFVAVEDRRFEKHRGIDWMRIPGAALANLRAGALRQGSSTITMQLARNVFPEVLPGRERTFRRKLQEARVAQRLEAHFEKREILEMYLNHIYFGGGAYGVEAAARLYFGKPASDVTLAEAATLAALPKAPSHYDPRREPERSQTRRNLVLALMVEQGKVEAEAAEAARSEEVTLRDGPGRDRSGVPLGAYFIDVVRSVLEDHFGEGLYRSRLRIYTTLDPLAQRAAEEELERQLATLDARVRQGAGELQGAMVVLEAHTGDVLALVGGRDPMTSRYNRATLGRRQLGSAFKPFVFAAALAKGVPTSRVLLDLPYALNIPGSGVWQPVNYDGGFEGTVSMREALVRSRNIPTVRLAADVGIGDVARTARAAGVDAPMDETPSLALGTVAMSPLRLAAAYTTFATLGWTALPRFLVRVEDEDGTVLWEEETTAPVEGMDPRVAYIVTDVLEDAVNRGTGTGVRSAGFRGPAAGKTGTTNDATDAWFVGYTPDVVGAVWIGFDQPSPLGGAATGGGFAAPIWGRVMTRLYAERPLPAAWTAPPGIVQRRVDSSNGLTLQDGCQSRTGTPINEIFLAEYVPSSVCPTRGFFGDFWSRIRGGR